MIVIKQSGEVSIPELKPYCLMWIFFNVSNVSDSLYIQWQVVYYLYDLISNQRKHALHLDGTYLTVLISMADTLSLMNEQVQINLVSQCAEQKIHVYVKIELVFSSFLIVSLWMKTLVKTIGIKAKFIDLVKVTKADYPSVCYSLLIILGFM